MPGSQICSSVKPPAIGLIVTGGLAVLMGVYRTVVVLTLDEEEQAEEIDTIRRTGDEFGETFARIIEWGMKLAPITISLQIIGGGLIVWGAIRMLKIRSRGWGYAAAIISIVPFITDCCCMLGLGFGIWAMVVLGNTEVKQLFSGTLDTPDVFD